MTKNIKKLFTAFVLILLIGIFIFFTTELQGAIKAQTNTCTQYRAAIDKLQNQALKTITQNIKTEVQISYPISKIAKIILDQLKTNSITPIKYQILDIEPDAKLEIQFNCSTLNFMSFLKQNSANPQPYAITYLTIKPKDTNISGIFRASETMELTNKDSKSAQVSQTITSVPMADLFTSIHIAPISEKVKILPDKQKEFIGMENGNNLLKIIGTITESDNFKYLYVKDFKTKHLYKLALDGSEINKNKIIENTTTSYIIQLQGNKFSLQKKEVQ